MVSMYQRSFNQFTANRWNKLQNGIDFANDPNTKLGDFRTGTHSANAPAKSSFVSGVSDP